MGLWIIREGQKWRKSFLGRWRWLQPEASCIAAVRWWLSDTAPPVLCKHGSTVPLKLRWSGYASLSETNGHIMTQARWLMTIPASSLTLLLYHSVPPCMPYFCLLAPISSVQRHFIGMKYTFLTILHITRETKSRASQISTIPSSIQNTEQNHTLN